MEERYTYHRRDFGHCFTELRDLTREEFVAELRRTLTWGDLSPHERFNLAFHEWQLETDPIKKEEKYDELWQAVDAVA